MGCEAVGKVLSRGSGSLTFAKREAIPMRERSRVETQLIRTISITCGSNVAYFCSNVTVKFSLVTTRAMLSLGKECPSVQLVTIIPFEERGCQ